MDDEDPWLARIQRSVDAIRAWEQRVRQPESPGVASALAKDDQLHPKHPASLVAWSSIGAAVDHLGLAVDSLEREGGARLRPTAFYSVCRSALVAASQAVWVMTGTQQQRLERVRWCEAEEHLGRMQLLGDYIKDPNFKRDVTPEFHSEAVRLRARGTKRRKEILAELKGKHFKVTDMLKTSPHWSRLTTAGWPGPTPSSGACPAAALTPGYGHMNCAPATNCQSWARPTP